MENTGKLSGRLSSTGELSGRITAEEQLRGILSRAGGIYMDEIIELLKAYVMTVNHIAPDEYGNVDVAGGGESYDDTELRGRVVTLEDGERYIKHSVEVNESNIFDLQMWYAALYPRVDSLESNTVKTVNNTAPDKDGNVNVESAEPYDDTALKNRVGTLETEVDGISRRLESDETYLAELSQYDFQEIRDNALAAVKSVNGIWPDADGNVEVPSGESYDDTELRGRIGAIEGKEAAWNSKVSDVKVKGSALVKDENGAVELPIASSAKVGLIYPNNAFWVSADSAGNLYALTRSAEQFKSATASVIIGKGTLNNVLATPSIMPALTEAEQAAARARIGVQSVTDDHINDLIDAKLGVIENGSY